MNSCKLPQNRLLEAALDVFGEHGLAQKTLSPPRRVSTSKAFSRLSWTS